MAPPSTLRTRPRVSVVGSGREPLDAPVARHAREVGAGLAERGWVLVTGGLTGTMEAVGEAYEGAGGPLHVGLLPGTDGEAANPHVHLPIPTGQGHVRNTLVATAGDAVVALAGGSGTLSEVGFAGVRNRPVVAVDAWHDVPHVETVPTAAAALTFLDEALDGA